MSKKEKVESVLIESLRDVLDRISQNVSESLENRIRLALESIREELVTEIDRRINCLIRLEVEDALMRKLGDLIADYLEKNKKEIQERIRMKADIILERFISDVIASFKKRDLFMLMVELFSVLKEKGILEGCEYGEEKKKEEKGRKDR